jgi:hypothetical protein
MRSGWYIIYGRTYPSKNYIGLLQGSQLGRSRPKIIMIEFFLAFLPPAAECSSKRESVDLEKARRKGLK